MGQTHSGFPAKQGIRPGSAAELGSLLGPEGVGEGRAWSWWRNGEWVALAHCGSRRQGERAPEEVSVASSAAKDSGSWSGWPATASSAPGH
jgi:hypothetical protein